MQKLVSDVLILGSGAAGLTLALQLAEAGIDSLVVSKGRLSDGSTRWAQGGISAVLDGDHDSFDHHINDTLIAGAGLCDEAAVRHVVEQGPACVHWLVEHGVPFTRSQTDGRFHLTREGGHSQRRIIHAADATGRALETTLETLARAEPRITLKEHLTAIDLITSRRITPANHNTPARCLGAYVLDSDTQRVGCITARAVVLATGGASMAYLFSTNPHGASGDGIAMAWRAGCRVADMEFMQFHPTCLFHPQASSFLISEALRGEGALLKLPDGSRFMPHFDERAELAPRDIVARAIDHEMKRLGIDHVLLDISHKPADFIRGHFPTIHARCLALGIDMTREALPVVPAAHYTCGGILTDLHGCTDLAGLYAIGETASTGLHGANRMASNSLLECLVMASSAARHIASQLPPFSEYDLPDWDESRVTDSDDEVVVAHNWQEVRRFMWDYVGIVRSNKRLQRAQHRIDLLKSEIQEYYGNFRVSADLIELRNLVLVAELIVRCALHRQESRGLHHNLDYPHASAVATKTVLSPGNGQASSCAINTTGHDPVKV